MHALEELQAEYDTELLFVESGGDNLAGPPSQLLLVALFLIAAVFYWSCSQLFSGACRLHHLRRGLGV